MALRNIMSKLGILTIEKIMIGPDDCVWSAGETLYVDDPLQRERRMGELKKGVKTTTKRNSPVA